MTTLNTLLDWALWYAARFGWHVFPLRPQTKEPFHDIGVYQATSDSAQIHRWWSQWPQANIGLHCGPSGVLALDLDAYKAQYAGADLLTLAERRTTTNLTGNGGEHLLYQMPAGEQFGNSSGNLPAGVDIRGAGGYLVLPPSLHPSGRQYQWELGFAPHELSPQSLPEKLYRLLKAAPTPNSIGVTFSGAPTQPPDLSQWPLSERILHLIHAPPPPGKRSEADQCVITALLRVGTSDDEIRAVFDHYPIGQQGKYIEKGRHAAQYLGHSIVRARQYLQSTQPEHFTDLGNARRLVRQWGQGLRYCHAWRRWLVWDGKRWAIDTSGEVMRRAKATVQALYAEAAQIADDDKRAAVAKWAMKSEAYTRLKAMIELAKSEPGVPVAPDELDANGWLLNVQNGTLDLKTGTLRPHRRADLITKLSPVTHDPAAACPTWLQFLERILEHNQGLIGFLQRAFGYALTGDTSEQVLFFCYGTGANGKSTLLETIRAVLGSDYAQQTPTETLLVKARGGGISNDLARLRGARLVSAVEADAGRNLAEALVKQITGGDTIAARRLYEEYFEFKPGFKLFVAANSKPRIQGMDHAIWRRIHLIPFTVTIPAEEQDKTLPHKLSQEWAGILAWGVRGCLTWQTQGLGVPAEVQAATQTYRTEMDVFGGFLNDCCLLQPTAQVTSKALYTAYGAWCEDNGERPLPKRSFGIRLQERDFTPTRLGSDSTRAWRGLRLRTATDVD